MKYVLKLLSKKITLFSWSALLFLLLIFCPSITINAEEITSDYETIDLSDFLLHTGGLGYEADSSQPCDSRMNSVASSSTLESGTITAEEAILNGLTNRRESIELSSYNLSRDAVSALYTKIANQHPELFYITGGFSSSSSGGYVSYIYPRYDSSYTQADVATYNNKITQIISGIDNSWPAIQKVLYLHDYLVTHVEYDQTYSKYNAYNALVEGSSVCQGYSLAFVSLMNSIGINCDIITSRNLNHAWNLVELDGQYFYVDATWDDPTNTNETYCGHKNFLVDKTRIIETGHTTSDWISTLRGINVYDSINSSSQYNDFYWKDMTTAVPLIGTKAVFLTTRQILMYDFSNASTSNYNRTLGTWYVWGENNGWWSGDFCSMVSHQNNIYYSTQNSIYKMGLDGTSSKVYTLSSAEASTGYIYGLSKSGNTINYILQTEPNGETTGMGSYFPNANSNALIENFVTRMYQQCLSREPDSSGLNGWVSQLANGYANGASIAQQFVFSDEMLSRNLSNEEFVRVLYKSMMDRTADETGLSGWVYQLNQGNLTRSQVTKSFVESEEFTNICNSYGITRGTYDASIAHIEHFVSRFYTLCLERNADQLGLYGWVHSLKKQYMNGAQIANAFFFSQEFMNRNVSNDKYVELLYNTLMGRPSDANGKAGWVSELNAGHITRFDMMEAFIYSAEFTQICNTYNITRGSN